MLEAEESVRSMLLSLCVVEHCTVRSGVDGKVEPLIKSDRNNTAFIV